MERDSEFHKQYATVANKYQVDTSPRWKRLHPKTNVLCLLAPEETWLVESGILLCQQVWKYLIEQLVTAGTGEHELANRSDTEV